MYRKLYTLYNSLKFTDSFKLNTAKFMFRAINHSLPPNFQNLFKVKAYDNHLFHRIRIILLSLIVFLNLFPTSLLIIPLF